MYERQVETGTQENSCIDVGFLELKKIVETMEEGTILVIGFDRDEYLF